VRCFNDGYSQVPSSQHQGVGPLRDCCKGLHVRDTVPTPQDF